MSFLVTQFPAGQDASTQVVRLALAVNREMARRNKERYRILVPWIYGEEQKQRLREICLSENQFDATDILLDERLGGIMSPFLSNESGYAVSIALWVSGWQDASRAVRTHFSGDVTVMTLDGQLETIAQPKIALELHRASRLHFGMALAYQVTSCPLTRLFHAMETTRQPFSLGPELLLAAQKTAEQVERNVVRTFISVPGAFAGIPPLDTARTDRTHVPPLTAPTPINYSAAAFSVTTGTADTLWQALLSETPLLLRPFERTDDPEIFFHSEQAVKLGIGRWWKGEPLSDLQTEMDALRPQIRALKDQLWKRFGTEDGVTMAARSIVDDLLREARPAYG